ncbi:ankyrin repeat domain-containing protein 33B [Tamandua tetradactyla]|uniref:ankyrin repeat domain-containing protein 33B n=1 Tax=Tamandua tetradactyla TaxID=48850 RepID=UPI004054128F
MVLLAGPGSEGGGAHCVSPRPPSPSRSAPAGEDPAEPQDYEDFTCLPDTRSVASDDSFYPPGGEEEHGSASEDSVPEGIPEAVTLLHAARTNDVGLLRALVRRGPSAEEVQETDRNGRTGLIIACYHGFVDTVVALAECPHVDVNWQDSEGNTALITAAQAGHATITNYLLNYFPGLDLERRNVFGFTALMKAAMQGRTECIRALMLAGADVHARDPRRGLSPQEWAAYTGRSEAVRLIQRLLERPCPQQFGDKYRPELLLAPEAGLKPGGSRNCLQRLAEFVRSTLTSRSSGQGPEDGGVLDHMVRVTTSLYSPAVAIVCQTVCPENPPCVGKRRLAVQEILGGRGAKVEDTEQSFRTSQAEGLSREGPPRAGLPSPHPPGAQVAAAAPRKASLLPLQLPKRGSVRPGLVIPRVRVSKAPAPTFQPERPPRKGSPKDSAHLQIPKWRYKEAKEEKRKAEEAEKQRKAAAQKERRAPPWRKRT